MNRPSSTLTAFVSIALLILAVGVFAQEKSKAAPQIPDGSRIFISEMEGGLHTHIASQITKKKLPVVIVMDEKEADYVISGAALKGDNKWYHSVFGSGKDKNEGNIQVVTGRPNRNLGRRSWRPFINVGKRLAVERVRSRLVSSVR